MENFIVIVVLALIVGAATAYLVKARKSGIKCIGCPSGANCPNNPKSCKKTNVSHTCGIQSSEHCKTFGSNCISCKDQEESKRKNNS